MELTKEGIVPLLKRLNHEHHFPRDLQCLEFTPAKSALYQFTVDEFTASIAKNIFGGVLGLLTDGLTAVLLAGGTQPHVTTTMNISYFRPAPIHTRVTVRCSTVFWGKTAKTLEARFENDEGKLIAVGTHGMLAKL